MNAFSLQETTAVVLMVSLKMLVIWLHRHFNSGYFPTGPFIVEKVYPCRATEINRMETVPSR